MTFPAGPTSKELNLPADIFGIETIAEEVEKSDEFTDAMSTLFRVHDTGVFFPCLMMPEKVLVLGEDHAVLSKCESNVGWVGSRDQVSIRGGGHIDAAHAKTVSDSVVNIFIKMQPYHCLSPWRLISEREGRVRLLP